MSNFFASKLQLFGMLILKAKNSEKLLKEFQALSEFLFILSFEAVKFNQVFN